MKKSTVKEQLGEDFKDSWEHHPRVRRPGQWKRQHVFD